MKKKYISELGTQNDSRRRQHVCIDGNHVRSLVEKARQHMFHKGRLVNGKSLQGLLGNHSLTPTHVSL
jgi:hypothetical protein